MIDIHKYAVPRDPDRDLVPTSGLNRGLLPVAQKLLRLPVHRAGRATFEHHVSGHQLQDIVPVRCCAEHDATYAVVAAQANPHGNSQRLFGRLGPFRLFIAQNFQVVIYSRKAHQHDVAPLRQQLPVHRIVLPSGQRIVAFHVLDIR